MSASPASCMRTRQGSPTNAATTADAKTTLFPPGVWDYRPSDMQVVQQLRRHSAGTPPAGVWSTTSLVAHALSSPAANTPVASQEQEDTDAQRTDDALLCSSSPTRRTSGTSQDNDEPLEPAKLRLINARAAKRQKQRARRRLSRIEAAGGRLQDKNATTSTSESSEGDTSSSVDMTDTTAGLDNLSSFDSFDLGDEAFGECAAARDRFATEEEGKWVLVPRWDRYNLSVEVVEESVDETEAPRLPQAQFETTPEFEQFRVGYRQFRLGSGFGAKGEVSGSPKDSDCESAPWEQISFWTCLRDSAAPVTAQA